MPTGHKTASASLSFARKKFATELHQSYNHSVNTIIALGKRIMKSKPLSKLYVILSELRHHAPFTLFGAATGILCMLIFNRFDHHIAHKLFYIFHPAHVVLSAMVTGSMFYLHSKKKRFGAILLISVIGSLGIATLSDSLIPYVGEWLLGTEPHWHIGFIEAWYIVNPAALLGALIAYFWPHTKFPHSGHVLLSTWASSFHMIMALGAGISLAETFISLFFLFLAVWLPCCVSDIVFPLLFVKLPGGNQEYPQKENDH